MTVFVSALDWGLGHATRIIPTIHALIKNNHHVIIGASERQKVIYKEFFAEIEIVAFKSFAPKYSSGKSQLLRAFVQTPVFMFSVLREHIQLKSIVKKYNIHLVLSDNRYGLFHSTIKSIFIGHQLQLQLPPSIKFLSVLANSINHGLINRFDECWVPDTFDSAFAGALSVPQNKLKIPVKYKGVQSRFSVVDALHYNTVAPDILVLISGPEKQRSVFERKMCNAIEGLQGAYSSLIVRGLPLGADNSLPNAINHCPSNKLKTLILNAKYIVCRSGYSTIMDLVYLKSSAVLVPTPGQTEQEYLAEFLSAKGSFNTMKQEEISTERLKHFIGEIGEAQ